MNWPTTGNTKSQSPGVSPIANSLAALGEELHAAEADRDAWKARAEAAEQHAAMLVEKLREFGGAE